MIPAEDVTTRELTINGVTVIETSLEFTPPEMLQSDYRDEP